MTMQIFELSSKMWQQRDGNCASEEAKQRHEDMMQSSKAVQDHKVAKQAAKASAKCGEETNNRRGSGLIAAIVEDGHSQKECLAFVAYKGFNIGRPQRLKCILVTRNTKKNNFAQEQPKLSLALIDDWLDGARCKVNAEQFKFLQLVADRLAVEFNLKDPESSLRTAGAEPLRYLLHGPPGTGKSHALRLVEELFILVGFKKGIDFQALAFQAATAADSGGDTIHFACSFNTNPRSFEQAMNPEKAKRLAFCRWLFIDEISMVPANLLAQLEQRMREIKPSVDAWKHDPASGHVRPFAGVNVILVGDFNQLPPPQGGYLADIPHHLRNGPDERSKPPDPMADAGKKLIWEDIEGVVELTERERCKDEWWNEVTDEWRAGQLSEKNWRYLRGMPVQGCRLSTEERASRCRVITGPRDPRLLEAKFQEAPVIVANNDSKYQINKDRARKYAQDTGAELRWAIAKDVASTEVSQAQACDKDRKIKSLGVLEQVFFMFEFNPLLALLPVSAAVPEYARVSLRWLQYHDKDTKNLLGTLPLAIGMRVALTEHIDRSPDKQLLRGKTGIVHSWVWPDNDPRPSVVYVKFDDADWQLQGVEERGLYPIARRSGG